MIHRITGRDSGKMKTKLKDEDKTTQRAIFLRLGAMAALLAVGGGAVGYLLNDGHFHASMFIGLGAVMICVGLGAGVLTEIAKNRRSTGASAADDRVNATADMVVGVGLFTTVAAIMSPFLQTALNEGFRNISSAEQYAIVAVGLGLMAALGSLFWEQR